MESDKFLMKYSDQYGKTCHSREVCFLCDESCGPCISCIINLHVFWVCQSIKEAQWHEYGILKKVNKGIKVLMFVFSVSCPC